MQRLDSLDALSELRETGCALCIGVFDGVHRGHRALLDHTIAKARALGAASLVFTFAHHPLRVLAPPYAPPELTSPEEKLELIEAEGIDATLMVEFTREFAATPAGAFVEDVLVGRAGARFIACGPDFRFGAGGRGNVALLRELGPRLGFEVGGIEPVFEGASPVKSTRIRQCLLEGRPEDAALLLGRDYTLAGTVTRGDGRGRTIGVPTANLVVAPERLVPTQGVYAVRARLANGTVRHGVLNIGVRPTFETYGQTIEVHLLDFEGDLYGQSVELEFVAFVRGERTFESAEALVAQIRRDAETARELLARSDQA